MLISHAADKMYADRQGSPLNVTENIAPTADGPAGHVPFVTDLGGIDHLFRDPFTSALHVIETPLEQATGATTGPNGGSIPAYLQHKVTQIVDGAERLDPSLTHPATSLASATGDRLYAAVSGAVHRLRLALGV